ncbi:MAG TPA: 1,2-phenylacetyl-CoA epoxidase subunit PaaC [Steroidobacteraceae bacterium]|nr:1,2-phenylacetyl-CoA epoxidase subunit PaaC [Steroidobacteraceae bacterium]
MSATTEAAAPATVAARFDYLLQLADTSLILGQRLGEWVGHAPAVEEDLGIANTALDLIGQARLLLTYAGEVEGRGRTEDQLAFLREQHEYRNPALVEQPNGDFGHTMVRQVLIDAYQLELHERLQHSTDARLAAIAAKALKETRYHLRYSGSWLIRLGDGTEESHARVQQALDRLWPFTRELFDEQDAERALVQEGVVPALADVEQSWSTRMDGMLREATLQRPGSTPYRWFGRRGVHTEHLGYLLADMQFLQRTHPGAEW